MTEYYVKDTNGGYYIVKADYYFVNDGVLTFHKGTNPKPFMTLINWIYVTKEGYPNERRRPS